MMRLAARLTLMLSALSLAASAAPKFAPDLAGLKPGTKIDVIIQFRI